MANRILASLWPGEVDIRRPGVVLSLLGTAMAFGFIVVLAAGFFLPYRLASNITRITVWYGPLSSAIVLLGALLTRRRPRTDDWRLARLGLCTLVLGPIAWAALFGGRIA